MYVHAKNCRHGSRFHMFHSSLTQEYTIASKATLDNVGTENTDIYQVRIINITYRMWYPDLISYDCMTNNMGYPLVFFVAMHANLMNNLSGKMAHGSPIMSLQSYNRMVQIEDSGTLLWWQNSDPFISYAETTGIHGLYIKTSSRWNSEQIKKSSVGSSNHKVIRWSYWSLLVLRKCVNCHDV